MNNLKSYTEYAVSTPTTDFVIGFDFNYGTDAVNVTVDGVPAAEAGYSVIYLNSTTMRLSPAVSTGVVRLQRETDIDVPDNQFTAGAKFIASNMDENFTQLRHAQQEVRDGFNKLSEDTYEIIDTLQVVGQAAQDAADAAEQAAELANDAAAQVSDKVPKSATLPTYLSVAAGIDPVTGVADGAYFNVRSSSDESYIDEYQNVGGSAVATGKSYPSSSAVVAIKQEMQEGFDLQSLKNRDIISIFDFDRSIEAVSGVDSSLKINAVIQANELTNTNPYLFFPATGRNYQLDAPLVFRKAVPKVFGQLPANYDRYPIDGWFLVKNSECGFDLGASENTHLGGSWTLENIGFKPATSDLNYVADGIRVTSARNAPERGYTITEVSVSKMKNGIYVKNSANFMAATMDIKNCNLSGNDYAFYADQKVDGLRFVGNQAEQNRVGGLRIRGAGSINISDNMLEGQPNAIEIDGWSVQAGTQAQIIGNYFEANYGDFLISFKDTSYGKGVLEIANNEIADLGVNWQQPSGKVIDFCRIYNNEYSYGYTILNQEAYPITFMDDATVLPSSVLYGKQLSHYIQKGFNGNFGSKVFTDNFANIKSDSTYTRLTSRGSSTETFLNTPFGDAVSPLVSDYFVAKVNAQAGDVITLNILFRSEFGVDFNSGVSLNIFSTAESLLLQMISANVTQDLNNKYVLGTFTFKMPSAHADILLRLRNSSETSAIQMIAGCVKNLGQFTAPLKIKQVLPDITVRSFSKNTITSQEISGNGVRSMNFTVAGARFSDFITVSYGAVLKPNIELEAYVAADNTVTVNFKNTTASMVTMPAGDLLIKRSKT